MAANIAAIIDLSINLSAICYF